MIRQGSIRADSNRFRIGSSTIDSITIAKPRARDTAAMPLGALTAGLINS